MAYADNMSCDSPYLFRTYDTSAPGPSGSGSQPDPTNYGPAPELDIWQVARATSAAPGYFPEIKIPGGNDGFIRFKDGGFGSNNPSYEAYKDIVRKHGGMHSTSMGPFVSIGTGVSDLTMFATKSGNLRRALANLKAAISLPPRTFKAHSKMEDDSHHDREEVFPYYRFDGGEDLGRIAMDAWEGDRLKWLTGRRNVPGHKTLKQVESAIANYIHDRAVQRQLDKCAQDLVRRRRLRMRDKSDWERYASFSYYECDEKDCVERRFDKAHGFQEHMRSQHGIKPASKSMDEKLKQCRRIYWVYRPENGTNADETTS